MYMRIFAKFNDSYWLAKTANLYDNLLSIYNGIRVAFIAEKL